MHIHMYNILEDTNILGEYQFGYRKGRGTGDAIFKYLNDLYDSRDRWHIVASCYLDLRKAFDSVDHTKLMNVVGKIGFHRTTTNG